MTKLRLPTLAAAGIAVLFAGACATGERASDSTNAPGTSASAPNVVTVKATDYAFDTPDTIEAGLTTVRLEAGGKELHHVSIIRLDSGRTIDDFTKALKPNAPFPAWAVEVGGPNPPRPGGVAEATLNFEPGNYVFVCLVPGPDGVPHVAKGMITPVTVTGTAVAATEPAPTVEIKLTDYAFAFSKPLTAGEHLFRVENGASQAHEVVLARLAPGKTAQDLAAWVEKMQGPPPAEPLGGVTGLGSGQHAYFPATLDEGEYALLCFVPDARDGKPHVAHGMMHQVRVRRGA